MNQHQFGHADTETIHRIDCRPSPALKKPAVPTGWIVKMRGPQEPTEPQMILHPADLAYVERLLRRIFFFVFLGVVLVFILAVLLLALGTDIANEISNLAYHLGQGKK